MLHVALRPVEAGDLDAIFDQMRDPESVHMAAFTAEDPSDPSAFDAHMEKILAEPDSTFLAIVRDSRLEKACFRPIGTEVSFAPARATEIEETILELPA